MKSRISQAEEAAGEQRRWGQLGALGAAPAAAVPSAGEGPRGLCCMKGGWIWEMGSGRNIPRGAGSPLAFATMDFVSSREDPLAFRCRAQG